MLLPISFTRFLSAQRPRKPSIWIIFLMSLQTYPGRSHITRWKRLIVSTSYQHSLRSVSCALTNSKWGFPAPTRWGGSSRAECSQKKIFTLNGTYTMCQQVFFSFLFTSTYHPLAHCLIFLYRVSSQLLRKQPKISNLTKIKRPYFSVVSSNASRASQPKRNPF